MLENFRLIALTSVIEKLFHKILAIRLEEYTLSNSIIDTSLQNGFLRGINWYWVYGTHILGAIRQ